MSANEHTAKPNIVTAKEWQSARDELLAAEKEATRLLDGSPLAGAVSR